MLAWSNRSIVIWTYCQIPLRVGVNLRIKGPINQYVVMRIAQIRRSRGLSRKKVAELTGIPHSSYTCLEGGWYKTNLDNLWKILGVLEANIQEVWPQAENKGNFRDDGFLKKVVGKARKKWETTEATYGDVVEAVAHGFRLEARMLMRKGKVGPPPHHGRPGP